MICLGWSVFGRRHRVATRCRTEHSTGHVCRMEVRISARSAGGQRVTGAVRGGSVGIEEDPASLTVPRVGQ